LIACEQCVAAPDRCEACGERRCAEHLVRSVEMHTRRDAGDIAVLRARFPDAAVVDFPLSDDLVGDQRTSWVEGWTAGENVCLVCRDAAAASALSNGHPPHPPDTEPTETAPTEPGPERRQHEALVAQQRDEYGPDAPDRARHARLVRIIGWPSAAWALLGLTLLAGAGALVGGLTQASRDWVGSADQRLADGGEPWLLAQLHRDRAGYVLGALAGLLVGLLLVLLVARTARRRRQARIGQLDATARRIGCGVPGCEICWVPKPAAALRLGQPVRAGAVIAWCLALGLAVGLAGFVLVATPAAAVKDFVAQDVPAALAEDCTPRPPGAGDYELVCAGPSIRRRRLSQVVYRHDPNAEAVSLSEAFAMYPAYRKCDAARTLPGRSGRLAYCDPRGARQASVWTVGENALGAALGQRARRFARLQLGPPPE
jgi:hypothetical protein